MIVGSSFIIFIIVRASFITFIISCIHDQLIMLHGAHEFMMIMLMLMLMMMCNLSVWPCGGGRQRRESQKRVEAGLRGRCVRPSVHRRWWCEARGEWRRRRMKAGTSLAVAAVGGMVVQRGLCGAAYGALGLGEALAGGQTPDYAEACLELAECVAGVFVRSPKAVQGAILADCAAAAAFLLAGSTGPDEARVRAASQLGEAIAAARSVPAAKRKALGAAFRRVLVEARRRQGRALGTCDEGDDGAAGGSTRGMGLGPGAGSMELGQVPEDVRVRVFSFLDPVSLGRCACVSRQWAREASLDVLWQPLFDHLTADVALGSDRIRQLCSAAPSSSTRAGEGDVAGSLESAGAAGGAASNAGEPGLPSQRLTPSGRSPRSLDSVLDLVDLDGLAAQASHNRGRGSKLAREAGTAKAWFLREKARGEGGLAALKAHGRLVCSLCEQLFWIPPTTPADAVRLATCGHRAKRPRSHRAMAEHASRPRRVAEPASLDSAAHTSIAETLKTLLGCRHGCEHVLVRPSSPRESIQLAILFDEEDSSDSDSSDTSTSSDDDDDARKGGSNSRSARVLIGSHRLE